MAGALIPAVIADDEPGMRRVLREVLERAGGFSLVGEAASGPELLEMVERLRPRLVFLDVEMPGLSGVECARLIQDTDPATVLIFATAHEQYMADAFEVYAFDYLLKPFKLARALQTLTRAREALDRRAQGEPVAHGEPVASGESVAPVEPVAPAEPGRSAVPTPSTGRANAGRLMLRHREGVQFLGMEDILLVQREERATVLYTTGGGRYVTSEALGEMEARLDPRLFFRCHKSYIVNLRRIDSITPYGRWTYIAKLTGTPRDALITHEKYEELTRRFA
jgi:two-component system LytT family response regulator